MNGTVYVPSSAAFFVRRTPLLRGRGLPLAPASALEGAALLGRLLRRLLGADDEPPPRRKHEPGGGAVGAAGGEMAALVSIERLRSRLPPQNGSFTSFRPRQGGSGQWPPSGLVHVGRALFGRGPRPPCSSPAARALAGRSAPRPRGLCPAA